MTTLAFLLLVDEASGTQDPFAWIGGLLGDTIGLIGGIHGTWSSLRHAKPGPEREFLKRAAVGAWALAILFVAGFFFVPHPWSSLLWILFGVLLFVAVIRLNRTHARIRAELANAEPEDG